MSVDVLSDVLRAVRLTGAVFFTVDATHPWAAAAASTTVTLPLIMPEAEHLIPYHVVTEGFCYGALVGEEPVRLEAGDVIVFPHGDPHIMSSAPGLKARMQEYPKPPHPQLPFHIESGGAGGNRALVVCGFLGCDARPFNPLLSTLPKVLHVSSAKTPRAVWLHHFVECAASESREKRSGGECVLAKLSELLFVEVVRIYLDSLPQEHAGWLSGLRDPYVGKALGLLHERAAHPWTLEELAHEIGLSRSVFAERFMDLVGQPPMQYLSAWRMQIAAGLLSHSTAKVAAVAHDTGYESESAFSRAFKKATGQSPAEWRRAKTVNRPQDARSAGS